jgi:PAS domain-containing protein
MSTHPENGANAALRARILELEEQLAASGRAEKAHHGTEASLRQTLAYAESIVDTAREPMLVLDGKLRVRTASRAFYETFAQLYADKDTDEFEFNWRQSFPLAEYERFESALKS